MFGIPTINIVAVIHLTFVAGFVGMFLCESVVEAYGSQNDNVKPFTARAHYLIDLFIELPLVAGILISGTALAFLVNKISYLHIALISIGAFTALYCPFAFFTWVRTRNKMYEDDNHDKRKMKRLWRDFSIAGALLFVPGLLLSLTIGFYLAYHRVIESIYG